MALVRECRAKLPFRHRGKTTGKEDTHLPDAPEEKGVPPSGEKTLSPTRVNTPILPVGNTDSGSEGSRQVRHNDPEILGLRGMPRFNGFDHRLIQDSSSKEQIFILKRNYKDPKSWVLE